MHSCVVVNFAFEVISFGFQMIRIQCNFLYIFILFFSLSVDFVQLLYHTLNPIINLLYTTCPANTGIRTRLVT